MYVLMDRSPPTRNAPRFTRPPDAAYEPSDEEYARHQLVNKAITKTLINRITGRGDCQESLYGARPSNQFFAGALVSQYEYREAQAEDETFQNFAQDISPFTIGLRFRVPATIDDDAEIEISPEAVGFQRRFPTLSEQKEETNENDRADVLHEQTEPDPDVLSGEEDLEESGITADRNDDYEELVRAYERVPFEWDEIKWTGGDLKTLAERDDPDEVELSFVAAHEMVENISNRFRERTSGVSEGEANEVPIDALDSEEAFQNYLQDTFSGETLDPLWSAELAVDARYESPTDTDEEYINVEVKLINTHGRDFEAAVDPEYEDWRDTLFDVGVSAQLSGTQLETFDSKEIENEYQYDGTIHAVGENCAIEPIFREEIDGDQGDAIGVRTETIPTYEQAKYLSRNPSDFEARMDVLAGNEGRDAVFETLEGIASAIENAENDYRAIKDEMTDGKTADARQDFDEAVTAFEYERERFEAGIHCLREDDRAYEAFTLCNQAFSNLGEFDRWRTFQIVFIVMSVVDLLKQASGVEDDVAVDFNSSPVPQELEAADIIYFPTGGGKTEAYLGAVTFAAFHDRLRGKNYGMAAFTKFPLRFLSLQQLQRAADVLAQAELLRRRRGLGGEEFSVGYLVGKQNTPNALFEDGRNRLREVQENEEYREDLLYVDECPFCGEESVNITSDRERGRIIHQCVAEECDEGELPIYISDREVYRYAPTFVVSTIDKISIIGMQRRMRTIFGQAKIRCAKHGYSGESQCVVDEHALLSGGSCTEDDWREVEPVEPPSLLIQDELHLLREEFGAFDSHYETFLQAYNNRITD